MVNAVDRLIENIIRTRNPSAVGLDPDLGKIPACYKKYTPSENPLEAAANVS